MGRLSGKFGASNLSTLLGTRRFGTFCFASLLANIGTWTQQVAQPWLLLSLGASSFLIGLDAFALGAPVWLLTLVGGVLAGAGVVVCFALNAASYLAFIVVALWILPKHGPAAAASRWAAC